MNNATQSAPLTPEDRAIFERCRAWPILYLDALEAEHTLRRAKIQAAGGALALDWRGMVRQDVRRASVGPMRRRSVCTPSSGGGGVRR